jgi:hypothetical protein
MLPSSATSANKISRRFAHQLVRSRTVEADLATIREILEPAAYGPFQDELRRAQQGSVRAAAVLIAPSLAQLARITYSKTLEPEREIKWAKATIARHAAEINCFLQLKQAFSQAVLTGQYTLAKQHLDDVEGKFGQSFWLIKNRLALLQLSQGLEPQKRYAQQLKEGVDYVGPIAVVTQWVSARNESTVTISRFETDFEQFLARIAPHIPDALPDYLRYHILAPVSSSHEASLNVLRTESARALVDYYEAFVAYCQTTALQSSLGLQTLTLYTLKQLGSRLTDPRISVILTALGRLASSYTPVTASYTSYNLWCAGNYSAAYTAVQNELASNPDNAVALVVAALSSTLAGEQNLRVGLTTTERADHTIQPNSIQLMLSKGLQAIVDAGAAAHQEIRELSKLTTNFASLEWTTAFHLLVADEMSAQLNPSLAAAAALRVPRWHPLLLDLLGPAHATASYETAVSGDESVGVRYALAKINMQPETVAGLSAEAAQLLSGQQHFMSCQYPAAVADGYLLTNSVHSYFQRRGHRLIANSLLKDNKLLEACSYMSQVFVRDINLEPLLPLAEAVGTLRPNQPQWQLLQASLALPVLLDAHTKHVHRSTEALCGYAYEDFLTANGLERPSQLQQLQDQFDLPQLIYYLRYVCVEAIMDASIVYQGSHEVASERLNVCRLLVELDPTHEAEYRLEIRDLVRRQVISKRKREVEQSRIHIELPKLHLWASTELQEVFNRYITFIRAGLDAENTAIRAEAAARAKEQDLDGLLAMSVPNNETLVLFTNLVVELRNAYTSSAEFGLNRYLSTRIRHGTLETQLRWPVTAHHLITQRESENGPYQDNTYWTVQLGLDATESTALNQVFAEFSVAYDSLITNIRTEWVQIRHHQDQSGMFHFALADGEIAWLASQVNAQTSLKEFVDIVVKHFGERLTSNLSLIRQRLRAEAWPEARELLNGLQRNVHALNPSYMFSELDGAINLARTETAAVFERVTAWFRPTQAVGSSPYFLEDVLSVAEALVREASPTFRAPLAPIADDEITQVILFNGLTTLVDVFINIFENVVRRSGLDVPHARIELTNKLITTDHYVVSIVTRNALGPSINKEELRQQLEQKRRELAEGKYSSSITKEGGSGFFKIHRSLRDFRFSDKSPEATLAFGIEADEFFVEVQLPIDWRVEAQSSSYAELQDLLNL